MQSTTPIGSSHETVRPDAARRACPNLGSGKRVLLADDDDDIRAMIATSLRLDGFDVVEVRHGAQVLDWLGTWMLQRRRPQLDLLVTDVRMPGASGLELLAGLRRSDWKLPIVLITAYASNSMYAEAAALGGFLLEKPLDLDDLRTVVWNASNLCRHAATNKASLRLTG